ncbi:MAG: hypothetical protein JO154_14865 [Chitinophaga sp.]|uniref:hypothetical protein n=1 Tax=Chitinophaga sp. TaxID=1869181 RepID=UPI0025C12891|nr:hypothetical protein [Chitinophaga sp.]MBV8253882.1 hypothetical protein [Chitinophaga sp.]
MKLPLHLMALAMLACTVLASCKKNDPCWHLPSNKPKIKQLIWQLDKKPDTLNFYYNSKGAPISIIRQSVSTGYPNYRFNYDAQGRLITFIAYYNDFRFEKAYKFFYGKNDFPVSDSIYLGGFYNGNVLMRDGYSEVLTTTYSWDNQHRITSMDRNMIGAYPPIILHYTFNYNSAGNLTGYRTTDNKTNIKSLHPVWQLLSLDFSKNNGFIAPNYNIHQLPTSIPAIDGADPAGDFIYNIWLANNQVIYE